MSSPFHAGELAAQRQAGVVREAALLGRGISSRLAGAHRKALASMRMAVAASLDARGRVWASWLSGEPGFLGAVDDELLLVRGRTATGDPLVENLAARRELGLLAIDLAARIRIRVNGDAIVDPERGVFVAVREAYANCPKYIHRRTPAFGAGELRRTRRGRALDAEDMALVAAADTFFVASVSPRAGADASHRGGSPGFVAVVGDGTLEFPDYPGNNMFNTLGNLAVEPRAGLLFVDWGARRAVQLTGRATVTWSGATASVRYDIDEVLSHRLADEHHRE